MLNSLLIEPSTNKLYSGGRDYRPGRTKYTAPLPAQFKYTVPFKSTPAHSKVHSSIKKYTIPLKSTRPY